MLRMLFIERLFHCFRKHEGFMFSLKQCCFHMLGVWILGVRLAGLAGSERSGDCFRFDVRHLFLSLPFLAVWFYWPAWMRDSPSSSESAMELCFADRDTSVSEIFQVNQRIPAFVKDAIRQLELFGSVVWTELGEPQVFLCCTCWWFQPMGFWFLSGGLHLWTLPSCRPKPWKSRGVCSKKGLFGLDRVRKRVGSSFGVLEIIFKKSVR